MSSPISAIASTATGLISSAGSEPAERTSHLALRLGVEQRRRHLAAAGVVDADEQAPPVALPWSVQAERGSGRGAEPDETRARRGRRSRARPRRRRRARSRRPTRPRTTSRSATSPARMCWTTQASAPSALRAAHEVDEWPDRARARDVRTRSIGVICPARVRIGLIRSALPSHACAAPPIRPPRRRYSRVSTANQMGVALAPRSRRGSRRRQLARRRRRPWPRPRGRQGDEPEARPRSPSNRRSRSSALRMPPERPQWA